jgi:hypothetical protein
MRTGVFFALYNFDSEKREDDIKEDLIELNWKEKVRNI